MSRRTGNRPAPRMPAATSALAPQVGSLTGGAAATPAPSPEQEKPVEKPAPEPAAAPVSEPAAAPVAEKPAKPKSSRRANGTTRSWYLPHDVAEDLSETCDEIYHDLRGRQDKSEILGALIRVGLNNVDRVRKKFGLPPSSN
ncbi:hypothetical protein [Saccharothrix obliqua]|uniref:hypothetical protein n=1 Tax=Saccharothrix obliqua TaxID=2861747 RepID=UPI001C5D8E0C|nr:hypothetical protein [Saccharothrix obliqua]MBW4722457.1 hypothetical protein [Saccharothrix obliqua]